MTVKNKGLLLERLKHLVTSQPSVFGGALVVIMWLGINLPGLGSHGLWDPWEMDRAHIARQMTGAPRVLVVEERSSDQPLGPIARWLTLRYQDNLVVATPDAPLRGKGKRAVSKELERAHKSLDKDVFHIVVVDLALVISDPGSHTQVEQLMAWLDHVRARNPGTAILLAQPLLTESAIVANEEEWAGLLRHTYAEVRLEASGRELVGSTWGKPGGFRRELIKTLKRASRAGYAPFTGLTPAPRTSFLDDGFWRAAEKRKLDQRMTRQVSAEITEQLLDPTHPAFSLPEELVTFPHGAAYDALIHDFATSESTAEVAATDAVSHFESRIDAQFDTPWLRAQFKRDGFSWSAPPLDYWLMALSFQQLGFSELASRLPAFLLGLLGLLVTFRAVSPIWGGAAATLVGIVLLTSPLFFGQARSVAGEISFTVALVLIMAGILRCLERERPTTGAMAMLATGAVTAFLCQGVYGLLVPTAVAFSYVLLARDTRAAALTPLLLLATALGATWYLTATQTGWTFWSHFGLDSPLFNWALSPEDRTVRLNFDILLRQIGFGAAPWTALVPFGLGLLMVGLIDKPDRPAILVLMWVFVPYVVQSVVFKHNNHFVYPAIPAIAIAVGLLLQRVGRGAGLGAVVGMAAAILIGLLLSNAKKSPEPLTTYLTIDPPLGGSETASSYPEAMTLPPIVKYAMLAVAGLVFLHAARLATRARLVVSFFARPLPFFVAVTVVLAGLVGLLLMGLESQIAAAFNTRAGHLLELSHRLYVRSVFYWRPEGWALLTMAGASALILAAWHTPIVRLGWKWARGWLLTGFVSRWIGLLLAAGALGAAAGLYSDSLEVVLGVGPVVKAIAGVGIALGGILGLTKRFGTFTGWAVTGASLMLAMAWAAVSLSGAAPPPGPSPAVLPLVLAAVLFTGLPLILRLLPATLPGRVWRGCVRIARAVAGSPRTAVLSLLLGAGALIGVAVAVALPDGALMAATLGSPTVIGGLALSLWLSHRARTDRIARLLTCLGVLCATAALHLVVLADNTLIFFGFPGALPAEYAADFTTTVALLGVIAATLLVAALSASRVVRRDTPSFYTLHWALVTGTLALALTLLATLGSYDDGILAWTTTDSPVFKLGILAMLAWAAVVGAAIQRGGVLFSDQSFLSALRHARTPQVALLVFTGLTAWTLIGCIAQALPQSGLGLMDYLALPENQRFGGLLARNRGLAINVLVVLAALIGLNALWTPLTRRIGVAYGVTALAGLSWATIVISGMSRKWLQLESAVQADGAAPFLPYLFYQSRRTQVLLALIALLVVIALRARITPLLARLRHRRAALDTLAVAALALAGVFVLSVAGRLPWLALVVAMAGVGGWLLFLMANRRHTRVRALAARLGRPQAWVPIVLALIGLAITGFANSPAGLAIVAAPLIAAALSRHPLAGDVARRHGTRALMRQGVTTTLYGGLAYLVPIVLAWVLGMSSSWTGAAIGQGMLLAAIIVAAWAALVVTRLGLGLADIVERASLVAPAGYLFALAAMVRLATALRPDTRPHGLALLIGLAGVAGVLLVLVNALSQWTRQPPDRTLELLERPRIFVPALALAVAGFAFFYNQKLVTALSFHVSQKHILETVATAEGGEVPDGKLFRHGIGAGAGSSRNFYTKDIPEVKDTATALRALFGERDQVLALSRAGSSVLDFQIAKGFAPENDADNDGVRDFASDAGVARFADRTEHWIEDPDKHWAPDQWTGARLIDSEKWVYPITGNTASRVYYDPAGALAPPKLAARKQKRKGPAFDTFVSARNRYTIDQADAVEHAATAMARERIYFLLPKVGDHAPAYTDKGSFSDLNHEFRKLGGRHLAVLDDRSSRILLATSRLREGETDHNWLRKATLTDAQFLALVKAGKVRGLMEKSPLAGIVQWKDSVKLLGYSMDSYAVSKGKKLQIHLYFKAVKNIAGSNKIFMHLDRTGHRIHCDHWPLAVSLGKDKGKHCIGCFQTDHWLPGDIVVDSYEHEVPFGAPSGETDIWMGLFNPQGDKRLEITSWNDKLVKYGGKDNRAKVGSFVVR